MTTIIRRLGIAPSKRDALCSACNNCPDVFELDSGDFAIIGFDVTIEMTGILPSDAGCGEGEKIVRIPREVLIAASKDLERA